MRVLLTGASGYVGGRLLRRLAQRGVSVRCLARRPEFLASRSSPAEVVRGDVLRPETLARAFEGMDAAFYLVHSMASARNFEEQDRAGAQNFGRAALAAGVRRIVYLGGLGSDEAHLSAHLRSRHEVGRILRDSGVPVTELRASIVIGSGSLSFEMIRALVERLPLMVTPRWVRVVAQPIAVDDVLEYLVGALFLDAAESRVYEIGGADRVSYAGLMAEYARQRGLRRVMIPVPVLSPRLSSLWLGLVTPLYARVGRSLVQSMRHETVVRDERALRDFAVRPAGVAEAIRSALANEDQGFARTRWSDALSSAGTDPGLFEGPGEARRGRRLVDVRHRDLDQGQAAAFAPVRRIGGAAGWYAYGRLWRARGLVDLFAGGVGLRRGRRDPERLAVGDTVDWWRVEAYEPDRLLRLRAEMKLPGRAWLQFEVEPRDGGSRLTQTAIFDPKGLLGLSYWYGILPLHALVFRGMMDGLARAAACGRVQAAP